MRNFMMRVLINAIAIFVTAALLPGIHVNDSLFPLLMVAVIFSVVNSLLKPILLFLTCPAVLLTLGLFILVINGLILQITASIAGDAFTIDGFGTAFVGGIIMAIVNMMLESVVGKDDKRKKQKN